MTSVRDEPRDLVGALLESEARSRELIAAYAQATWEADADGVVVVDSPSWRAYTGQSFAEWLGYGWVNAVHPDDRDYAEEQWRAAVAARRNVDAEFRLRHAASGSYRWTNVRATPLIGADSVVRKWIGMNFDINDRKQAEEIQHESEDRHRSLFESIDEGSCVMELVHDASGRIVDLLFREVNGSFQRQTGLPNVTGRKVSEVLPNFEQHWLDICARVAETGRPERSEKYVRDVGRWYRVHNLRIGGPGSRLVAVVFDDVTERKRTETALRESEERQAFLLKLSDALRPLSDALAIQKEASRLLRKRFGAARVCYLEVTEDEKAVVGSGEDVAEGVPSIVGQHFRFEDFDDAAPTKLRLGQAVSHDDIETVDGLTFEQKRAYGAASARSWVGIPIVKSGRLVAALAASFAEVHSWRPTEITLLSDVAERTRIAIDKARAEAALRESEATILRELENTKRLQEISSILIEDERGGRLHEQILDAAVSIMRADFGSIQMLAADRNELRLIAWRNFHAKSAEFWKHVSVETDTICGSALRHGKRIVVPDVFAVESLRNSQSLAHYELSGIASVQSTPLTTREGRMIGMISTHWRSVHTPNESALRGLDILARQAADFFERRRVTEALRESESRLAAVLESLPVGVGLVDEEGRLVLSNPEIRRFLPTGIIPSRDPERSWRWRGVHPDGRVVEPQDYPSARALRGERDIPGVEMVYTGDDGREIWTRISNVPIRDGDGRVTSVVAVVSDIDALKRSEEAARASEERLRQFGEASRDILWIRDAETLQWEYLTPAFESIYGLSREEALSGDNFGSWLDLVLAEDRGYVNESIRRVRAGEHLSFEYRIRRPSDGEVRWLRNTDFPIYDRHGVVFRIGGIGRDISAMKAAEEHERLLLAELQHRVRNILATIRSIASRTCEGNGGSLDDFRAHFEGRISALARTQSVLTRSPGAGVDLEMIVRDELLAQAANEEHFSINGPDIRLAPKAAEVLTLAIHELATNATKYGALTRDRGRIMIEWHTVLQQSEIWLKLSWTERGVPTATTTPIRKGFGTELVTRRIPYELQGTGAMDFKPGGVHAEIAFPLRGGESILETGTARQFRRPMQ